MSTVTSHDPGSAWHAKEVVRSIYDHYDPDLAREFVTRLDHDLQDDSCPPEVCQLGRTVVRWRHQIAAWHHAHVSNGPTEAVNLLYAGRPNWDLLATVTPR